MTTLDLRRGGRTQPPREDALPEHVQYRDDGCDIFASCLSCPLPRCRYDVPGGARTMLNVVRDAEIRRMRFEGDAEVDDIARRFRVSRRTVFRILRPGRAAAEGSTGDPTACPTDRTRDSSKGDDS